MIGIDLVKVDRIIELNKDYKLEQRILSDLELEYLHSKSKNLQNGYSPYDNSLAGFWAGKEAVLKCLGVGLNNINLKEIEILHLGSGAPYVKLSNKIFKICGIKEQTNIQISISHDGGMAISVAFCAN